MEDKKIGMRQRRYKIIMAAFIALTVFLTFFSKTIYSGNMPAVKVTFPVPGKFVETVEGSAVVSQCVGRAGMWELTFSSDSAAAERMADKANASKDRGEAICDDASVSVKISGITDKIQGKVVSILTFMEGEETIKYSITVEFEWEEGDIAGRKAQAAIREPERFYDAILPARALHRDNVGYYVLSMKEEDNILGNYYVVNRISVDLLDTDGASVALVGVMAEMPVITSDTEELTEGTKVKLQQ